jgi:5'-nucleotidase
MKQKQILLTNDDGIDSYGLLAAARALSPLGEVHIAAPREQYSAAGRSLPLASDGIIQPREINLNGKTKTAYAVGGSPAQTVLFALLEILPVTPDLLVSGINYGENIGSGITVSGTVGAALEASAMGIPSLAISLETDPQHHLSLSDEVDFSTAAHFTNLFSEMMLKDRFPTDVDILKVDIPCNATPETPWKITRVSRNRYYYPTVPKRESWNDPVVLGYEAIPNVDIDTQDTDVYALQTERLVSVSPISLDMTSRIDLSQFEKLLQKK